MILLIDNYDSFTYNLYQYLGEMGEKIVVKRNDKITLDEIDHMAPDQIILSPGPGTPNSAGICLDLIQTFSGRIPILGVCLGHQSIAQAFGGKIVHAPEIFHGKISRIQHDNTGIYEGLPQMLEVGRYHSLIADRATLPNCLKPTSWTEEGIIMGIRHKEHPTVGIQFHPESILTVEGKHMLQKFLSLYSKNQTT